MILKRTLFFTIPMVIFASMATGGGPDITELSTPEALAPAVKAITEEIIEPIMELDEREIVTEVPQAEIILAQPSNARLKRPEGVVMVEKRRGPRKVTVLFESSPTNAEIMVNGLYVGSTPIQMPLYDGVHNVRMFAPGYTPWERQIKAYQGLRVYVSLQQVQTAE